ncbi:LuxR C-terminal-related transcriptional regulator [Desertibacillus haloalkaliphilus]|uniref:LuxR C-terminal-related transcriptional regulator n=1 Tax=Desertibacillus haloalkaliphilus TaxID=1328930 RepID=UPI001C274617|nr:LuxR C-terminal-related transcriptional regulator [Desertibacillus haloalkaliphilus]MBU8906283.1 LuxR C-terminal-related transcriptional regulator [Desertibacillus haloalkaliphilus]
MNKSIDFIQDVQDTYASLTKLTMCIVDSEGNFLTDISTQNTLSSLIHQHCGIEKYVQESIDSLRGIPKTILIDTPLGLKYIVSPIKVQGQITHYLLAGDLLEKGTRSFVSKFILKNFQEINGLVEEVETLPELSREVIAERLKKVEKAAEIIEASLACFNEQEHRSQTSFLSETLESIRVEKVVTLNSTIDKMIELYSEVDFVGLALKSENDQFTVDAFHGENAESFKGHSFSMGEGFLGHTAAVQQYKFWKDVRNDPRSNGFEKYGLHPISIFSVPVYEEQIVIGILFGGSTKKEINDKAVLEQMKLNSSLLSVLVSYQHIKENLQNHLMELATFNEIFRVITTVKDIKRILYILVDISTNIIRGPFSCIVYKSLSNPSKMDVVSRGLTAAEINDYGHDVAQRISSYSVGDFDIEHPQIKTTNWGVRVLELPLCYNGVLYGVLSIGLNPHNKDEFNAFLSSLAVAGGIAIHLCQDFQEISKEDQSLSLLQDVISQHDQKSYDFSIKLKKMVEDFTIYLGENGFKDLNKVSGLAIYDLNFLEKYIQNNDLLKIVEGCKKVLNHEPIRRRDSQILGLVYKFLAEGETIEVVENWLDIDKDIRSNFISFINQRSITETNITLERSDSPIVNKRLNNENDNLILKEKLQLSTREIDVLNVVLRGYNNREIAKRLFISEHTVKNHITRIFQKLDVNDRSQAIAKVYQLGYTPNKSDI